MGLKTALVARYETIAVVLVALAPSALYVFGLGLYIDDWGFLWALRSSPDQSWIGLYRALAEQPALAVRPLQIAWLVGWYKLAPGSILAPHLANQALFAAAGALLLTALRGTRRLRASALAIVLVYLCTPAYMTARFWLANHQSGIGLVCFSLALLLARRWLAGKGGGPSLAGAALATAACLLSYALTAFVLLVAPVLLALADGATPRQVLRDRRVLAASAAIAGAFVLATVYKLSFGYGADLHRSPAEFVSETAWLYARAGFTVLWTHGIAAPYHAVRMAGGSFGSAAGPLAALLVLGIVVARRKFGADAEWPSAATPTASLFVAGLLVFGLGYVPFLANFWFGGSPFGTANRAHVAGALGAAMMFVALLNTAFVSRPGWGRAVLLLYCCAGVATQVTIGRVWGAAWDEQQRLAAEIETRAAPLPSGGTLLLYGHCPYYGPVPLFPPDSWLDKRLEMATGERDLAGNTIVPGTRAVAGGIAVRDANHIGDLPPGGIYPYAGTVIYDLREHRRYSIESRADAVAFFAAHPAAEATGCSYRGQAGLPLY